MHPRMADASTIEEEARRPVEVAGNRLTLLAEGADRLEAVLGLIEGARESLRILYYMFKDDVSGRRVGPPSSHRSWPSCALCRLRMRRRSRMRLRGARVQAKRSSK